MQPKRKIDPLKSTEKVVNVITVTFINNITYRNSLLTLQKQSKKSYYHNYFRNNINNVQNTWKGINNFLKH